MKNDPYIIPQVGDLIVFKKTKKIRVLYGKTYDIPSNQFLIITSSVGASLNLLSGKLLGIWYLNLISQDGKEYSYILRGGLVSDDSNLKECLFDSDVYLIQRKVICVP